jgi:hypothetical protein
MNHAAFLSILRRRLYPVLHAEGFRGNAATLRRIDGPSLQLFNVQAGSSADRCHLNLGVHFDFLPPEGGQARPLRELLESQCAFRERVAPPPEQPLGWFYGTSEHEADANAARIVAQWTEQARPFFRDHSYPDGLSALIGRVRLEPVRPRTMLMLARVAARLGDRDAAVALAELALPRVQPVASGLRHEIAQFLRSIAIG